ncbi:MAG TPA: shikimate kinase [Trebonia sp.]|jgi:shikimate kinase|nr:shikimate kinase [Trebonia sp.]
MIVVAGFMGAGKTTVGRLLADKLGVPFLDADEVIEARAGRPIRELFAADGEPAFRALEHAVIADLLAGPAAVLALGGGAAGHEATRALLTSGTAAVVYLRVAFAEALARVGGDTGRPMLARPDVPAVYAARQAVYASVATLTVDTDGRAPEDVVAEILARLDAPR